MPIRPRNLAAWIVLSLLAGMPASAASLAEPDPYAAKPAPPTPKPTPYQEAKGYGAALDPYKDQLSAEERQLFQKFSEELLTGPGGAVLKRADQKLREWQAKLRAENPPDHFGENPRELFTYTIPNDPLLMLGTAKSYVGPVTTPPRLRRGAFEPVPKAEKAKNDPLATVLEDDGWIYNDPAKICTRGLSYGLEMRSVYADLENLPVGSGGDLQTDMILTSIERMPNPIVLADSTENSSARVEVDADEDGPVEVKATIPEPAPTSEDAPTFPVLGNQEMLLSQFFPAFRRYLEGDDSPMGRLVPELEQLVALIPDQRKKCHEAHGRFREVHWADSLNLSLLSCEREKGQVQGFGARMTSSGSRYFPAVSLYVEDPTSRLGVELELNTSQQRVVLKTYKQDDYFGPQVQWNDQGQPMMLDFVLPPAIAARYGEYDVFEWHENGKLKFLGHRKAGKKAKIEQSWYASGALAGEVRFDEEGRPTTYKEWYENRRSAEETALIDGEMDGTRRWWHENGQPAGLVGYSRGRPTGAFTLWYDDGRIGTKGLFKNGLLDGRLAWLFEDGGTLYEGSFVKGEPDGPQKIYRPDGRILAEKGFKQGEPDGSWQAYDRNGKVLSDTTFAKGQKTGRSMLSYPNGQVFYEMPFLNGKANGPAKAFFKDGQLAATCIYEQDQLTSFTRYFATGEVQLEGKILNVDAGTGEFTTLTKDGRTTLHCQLQERMTRDCKIFAASGDELPFPADAELAKTARSIGKKPLKWQPSLCGGFDRQLNIDMLADGQGREIFVNYAAKQACAPGSAGRLACVLSIEKDRIAPLSPCQLKAYDDTSGELDRIIEQMDDSSVH